jgi:hypothetical protein
MATANEQLEPLKPALAAAWQQLRMPAQQNFLVCDFLTASTPQPRAVGLRNAVLGGFRELGLALTPEGLVRDARRLHSDGVPMVVVAASQGDYFAAQPAWLQELLLLWKDATIFLWLDALEQAGRMRFTPSGETLTLASAVKGGHTWSRAHSTLPALVTLQRAGSSGPAQVGISLSDGGDAHALESWFQLPDQLGSGEEVSVAIDVVCDIAGDRLIASVDEERLDVVAKPAPRAPSLQHLGVVFDRTALDGRAWLDGLRFAQGDLPATAQDQGGSFFAAPAAVPSAANPATPTAANFNRDLRSALQRAISGLSTEHVGLRFTCAAFAEQALDGLANPRNFQLPDRKVFSLLDADRRPAEAWLAKQTYSPGLDVWDPLEEALEVLMTAKRAPEALLLLTASPPNPPPDVQDPFAQFFHRTNTTGRDLICSSLRDLLAEAANRGIPVALVFLDYNEAPGAMDEGLQGPFGRFHELQQNIRETYREYPYLLLFDGSASDPESLTSELLETARMLAERVSARFWVTS